MTTTFSAFPQYRDFIAGRESSGRYDIRGGAGDAYLGRYQLGAAALEDAGYLKPGSYKRGSSVLDDPTAWTGLDGVAGPNDFLMNRAAQDRAFQGYTDRNLKTLQRLGKVTPDMDPSEVSGLLAEAHLVGPGNVGLGKSDAFGTSGSSYEAGAREATGASDPVPFGGAPNVADNLTFGGALSAATDKYLPGPRYDEATRQRLLADPSTPEWLRSTLQNDYSDPNTLMPGEPPRSAPFGAADNGNPLPPPAKPSAVPLPALDGSKDLDRDTYAAQQKALDLGALSPQAPPDPAAAPAAPAPGTPQTATPPFPGLLNDPAASAYPTRAQRLLRLGAGLMSGNSLQEGLANGAAGLADANDKAQTLDILRQRYGITAQDKAQALYFKLLEQGVAPKKANLVAMTGNLGLLDDGEVQGKKLGSGAQAQQDQFLNNIATAQQQKQRIQQIVDLLDNGKLSLDPASRASAYVKNKLGMSDENSQNVALFDQLRQQLSNDDLRLNKGVQTEGDAVRSMAATLGNNTDKAVVKQQLQQMLSKFDQIETKSHGFVDQLRSDQRISPIDWTSVYKSPGAAPAASAAPGMKTTTGVGFKIIQ